MNLTKNLVCQEFSSNFNAIFKLLSINFIKKIFLLIGVNFDVHSFVELFSSEDEQTNENVHYGLTVLHGHGRKSTLRLAAVWDLSAIGITLSTGTTNFIILGNPRSTWTSIPLQKIPVDTIPGKSTIYLQNNKALDVKGNHLVTLIVTKGPNGISTVMPPKNKNNMPHLDDCKELNDYLKRNQEDALIMRAKEGPVERNKKTDDLVFLNNNMFNKYPRYVTSPEGKDKEPFKSENRCETLAPFDHSVYQWGDLTPGRENDCEKEHFVENVGLYRRPIPVISREENRGEDEQENGEGSGEENVGEEAGLSMNFDENFDDYEEDMEMADSNGNDLFDIITEEQIDHSVYMDHMYLASERTKEKTPEGQTCPISDVNAAKNILEIASSLKKQRVIEGDEEDSIDNLRTAEQERRELHVEEAIISIQNHQADLLDTSLVQSVSEWFQYLPDSENAANSRFNCYYCSTYKKQYFIRENSEFASKEGVLKENKKENGRAIRNHVKSAGHQKTMNIHQRRIAAGIYEDVDSAIKSRAYPDFEETNHAFQGVFLINKRGLAFSNFRDLLNYGSVTGGNIGPGCRSPQTGTAMTFTIDKCERKKNAKKLLDSNAPFSLILGKQLIFHFCSLMEFVQQCWNLSHHVRIHSTTSKYVPLS